jgi:hypothetical protein
VAFTDLSKLAIKPARAEFPIMYEYTKVLHNFIWGKFPMWKPVSKFKYNVKSIDILIQCNNLPSIGRFLRIYIFTKSPYYPPSGYSDVPGTHWPI